MSRKILWKSRRASRRSLVFTASVGAATIFAAFAGIAPADAGSPLPTTSTTTATPSASTFGDSVTIKTKVSGAPVNPLLSPGKVTFSAIKGTTTTKLGTVPFASCVNGTCTASLTTTALAVGTTRVTGKYEGSVIYQTSTSSAAVTVSAPPPPPPGPSVTATCAAGVVCDSGTATTTSANGSTTYLRVVADASANSQTVQADLIVGGALHCPVDRDTPVGPLASFTNTAPDAAKTVTYTTQGADATAIYNGYAAHTSYLGCFGSPNQFNGYTAGSYGPAQYVSSDQLFEAKLSSCANNSGVKPCFQLAYTPGTPQIDITVKTLPGDPKFVPRG